MRPAYLVFGLFLLWAIACAASAHSLFVLAPTGSGFTRGMNRLQGFALWQMIASALAVLVWFAGRRVSSWPMRWVSRMPALLALGLTVFVIVAMAQARATPPQAPVAQQPISL